jgi:hypothetical protein
MICYSTVKHLLIALMGAFIGNKKKRKLQNVKQRRKKIVKKILQPSTFLPPYACGF